MRLRWLVTEKIGAEMTKTSDFFSGVSSPGFQPRK